MRFEEAEKIYFNLTGKHITKEVLLEHLNKLIEEIDNGFIKKGRGQLSIIKAILKYIFESILDDKPILIKQDASKIVTNFFEEIIKDNLRSDEEINYFNFCLNYIKRCSERRNGNRKY